ncbi:ABC transporter substrate-binding protein [Bacillus sp. APMAM]|nr:ABC transporter substrate-binding protein [Bacillus sp. APMAM]RTZ53422.1 ABC transporter substrate-binding protein [Bacillus sp. SAJ1]
MKKLLNYLSVLLLIFVLAGCGADQQNNNAGKHTTKSNGFPVTITDGDGNKLTIKNKPKRIVSLVPSNTETAFALGLDKAIVGVSDYDNYPEQVKSKTKVGGKDINIEKVISLKPDVVLATASDAHNSQEGLKQLEDNGIKVVVVNDATSFTDVYKSIEMIGKVTGTREKAEDIIDGMKSKVANIKEEAAKIAKDHPQKVWIEVSAPPNIYTTGTGTFMNEMVNLLGAKNIADDKAGWIPFSEEAAVKENPNVIVLTYGYYVKDAVNQVVKRKGWQEVSAVKNKRVYNVDSDEVSRPGPRLADGLEEMAKAIYPDNFK